MRLLLISAAAALLLFPACGGLGADALKGDGPR
jgi:hypothetical protein